MIEEDREKLPQESDATTTTPDEMTDALAAMKASSPSVGAALNTAGLTSDDLSDAHDRATSDEPDAATLTPEESTERGQAG